MNLIVIITPTYNRAKLLVKLFDSLCSQTSFNFKWYIVDDGSIDDTENVVKNFRTDNFEIEYIKKENGGKHTAINFAVKRIKEPLTFIVDSDDYLVSNAIEIIENDYEQIKDNKDICGLGYLKCYSNMKMVGKPYTMDGVVESFIEQRINKNTYGDKAEVFKTEVLKEYLFPIFEGENFVSESTIWCDIALKYKMKFFNKKIYICEYQDGGLSDGVHRRLFKNPNGAVACYLKMSAKPVKLRYKLKYTIAFSMYAFAAKMKLSKQFKMVSSKFIFICVFIFAYFLYRIKRRKFNK